MHHSELLGFCLARGICSVAQLCFYWHLDAKNFYVHKLAIRNGAYGALLLRGLPAALGRFAPSGGSLRSHVLSKRGSLRSQKDLI